MRTTRRDGSGSAAQKVSDLRVGPSTYRRPPLLMPVAVLIDSRTGSAAELLAVTLAEQRNALLVGEPSCGCVVGVRVEYVLPDGGGLRVAETGFVSARGARWLSPIVLRIVERIMGLLLAAIAMQFMVNALVTLGIIPNPPS
jgi:C-terminal processing protease CtpA/Prc